MSKHITALFAFVIFATYTFALWFTPEAVPYMAIIHAYANWISKQGCPPSELPYPTYAAIFTEPEPFIEEVQVIDYSLFSYTDLQELVKSKRQSVADVKINSKKTVLIEWLKANV